MEEKGSLPEKIDAGKKREFRIKFNPEVSPVFYEPRFRQFPHLRRPVV
jgi:hypothetical protein